MKSDRVYMGYLVLMNCKLFFFPNDIHGMNAQSVNGLNELYANDLNVLSANFFPSDVCGTNEIPTND